MFDEVYLPKMVKDFKEGKLDESGNSIEPSAAEQLQPEDAWNLARQTGSDIFQGGVEPSKEWKIRWERK